MYDVVIVGGGPAGLTAALWLGRCRRSVLLLDAGHPRNARSRWVSGFLTRDGVLPGDLRRMGREELARYDSVTLREAAVSDVMQREGGFETVLDGGERVRSRKLILATGLLEDVPDFPGAREFYGRGVYPCPYCDGWEHQNERLIAFGGAKDVHGMALELTVWSDSITAITHGPCDIPAHHRDDLAERGIEVIEHRIAALEGDPDGEGLERIRFETGRVLEGRAIFHAFHECRQSPLIGQIGCEVSEKGAVDTGHCERTNIPGLFVPGDASRRVKFAVVAAAEGSMAAFAANTELLHEDLARTAGQARRSAAE